MLEILGRVEDAAGPLSTVSEDDLEDRFADLDIEKCSVEEIWKRLPESERRRFQEAVANGDVDEFVPIWTPWWENRLSDDKSDEAVACTVAPSIIADLPPLSTLVSVRPASVLPAISNVLFGFAYALRLYNGATDEPETEAAICDAVLSMCSVLVSKEAVFVKQLDAIQAACSAATLDSTIVAPKEFVRIVLSDVRCLSSEKDLTRCALSELYRTFEHRLQAPASMDSSRRRLFQFAKRKVYFYLVWSSEQSSWPFEIWTVDDLELPLV